MFIHINGILARHIMKQLLLPFLCCFFGFIFLFFIADLQDELSDMMQSKNYQDIALYFLYIMPEKIPLITPMALLLASMYCFSKLNSHNEINAIRSSGISLVRMSLPVFIFAASMSLLLFLSNEYFQGYFNSQAEILHEKITEKKKFDSHFSFTITDKDEGWRNWELNFERDGVYSDVDLTYANNEGNLLWTIAASRAEFSQEKGWILYNASRTDHTNMNNAPESFAELPLPKIHDDPIKMRNFNKMGRHITIKQINQRLDPAVVISEEKERKYKVKYYSLIFSPFACLLSVLLGIPLSVTQARQGTLASSAMALGIMIGYYLLVQVFERLGGTGDLPAFIAGSFPTLSFIGLGVFISLKK